MSCFKHLMQHRKSYFLRKKGKRKKFQETSDLASAILEVVPRTRGGTDMEVGLGQRNAKGHFPGWSTCPNVHCNRVPWAAIMKGDRRLWVRSTTWLEEGQAGKRPPQPHLPSSSLSPLQLPDPLLPSPNLCRGKGLAYGFKKDVAGPSRLTSPFVSALSTPTGKV